MSGVGSEDERPRARVAGLVLAGGAGTRIGGGKALRPLAGRPLLAHVLARIRDEAAPVALAAGPGPPKGPDPARLAAVAGPDVALLPDPPGRAGPLAGIAAGLAWLADVAPDGEAALLVVPVDTPFLPPDLARRLGTVSPAAPAAVARSASGRSPVVALLHPSAHAPLERLLADDPAPPVRRFLDALAPRVVDVAAPADLAARGADPLFNVNTPEDLSRAEAILAGRARPDAS